MTTKLSKEQALELLSLLERAGKSSGEALIAALVTGTNEEVAKLVRESRLEDKRRDAEEASVAFQTAQNDYYRTLREVREKLSPPPVKMAAGADPFGKILDD